MKKLAILASLASLAIGGPAFACPMDHDEAQAPKTAQKDKAPKAEAPKPDKSDKAKEAPAKEQQKDQKPTEAKTKDAAKKPDKVSQN
jgi:hypothetical protein